MNTSYSTRRRHDQVVEKYAGTVQEMAEKIPVFDRRPLVAPWSEFLQENGRRAKKFPPHRHCDVIVRSPFNGDDSDIPVGVVSKSYGLIQHRELFNAGVKALETVGIDLKQMRVELIFTEYHGRLSLGFILPKEYNFDPGDGHPLALRLQCLNSVDGSSRLRIVLGWLRLVCSNGLVVGKSWLDVRLVHNDRIQIDVLSQWLAKGLESIQKDQATLKNWVKHSVPLERLVEFINGPLRKRWGVRAASRVFLICTEGWDGKPRDPFLKTKPSDTPMIRTAPVSGSAVPAENVYSVIQSLAWIANQRRDFKDQIKMTEQIPDLIRPLTSKTSRN